MNIEREQMKVKLTNLEQTEKRLIEQCEGFCKVVRINLNANLTPVVDMMIPETATLMDSLIAAWGELQSVRAEIGRLTEELA